MLVLGFLGPLVLHVDREHVAVLVHPFHVLVRVGRVPGLIRAIRTLVAGLLPVAGSDYVPFQVDFRRVIVRTVQTLIGFRVPRAVVVPLAAVSWNRIGTTVVVSFMGWFTCQRAVLNR